MKAPDKIYVEVCEDGIFAFPEPPFAESVEYIRADINKQSVEKRLEMAARHVWESWNGGTMDDVRRDMEALGTVLNARKEQPVDGLEEELENYAKLYPFEDAGSYRNLITLARHFAAWGAEHLKR